MNIAMITCHDENYHELASVTVPVKEAYCQKWGYEFVCRTSDFLYNNTYNGNPSDLLIGFEKLKMVLDVFEERPYLDWIHWSGTDVLITNYNVRLENIVDDDYHIVVCFDGNGMNVDSMLIKNSKVGRGLMRWILDNVETYRHHWWYEQQAMIDFYFQDPLGKDIIKALPQRVMNSYIYDLYPEWKTKPHIDHTGHDGDWQEGDFMLQLPGLPTQQRIDVMKEIMKKAIV
jgi:hypothetical protein